MKTSSFTRHHVNINMCRSKSVGTYTNSILAHQEVAHDGYDEALLLDVDGYVAEGAGETVTPSPADTDGFAAFLAQYKTALQAERALM